MLILGLFPYLQIQVSGTEVSQRGPSGGAGVTRAVLQAVPGERAGKGPVRRLSRASRSRRDAWAGVGMGWMQVI